ncbi:hypothetical protein [Chitinasiproducens palmae]|uniref:Uncharacterized protein n=1 Tax=Chitinasiproducens palmae TaxID=1770053 RepID=A0A1H2PQT8_9BURK|nr:hypothetical protein [Chitinasiproducens palmae]SDV49206.1 hypothetical protein SAMN05216551_107151 [Chitinasiproducens palmae]
MQIRDYDWSEIVTDLHRHGMERADICRALSGVVSDSTLRAYVRGVQLQPSHWRGELLLDLWCRRTGKARTEAPTRPAHLDNYCERRVTKMRIDVSTSALDALDAVFRPGIAKILRGTGAAPQESHTDMTMTLPGFER